MKKYILPLLWLLVALVPSIIAATYVVITPVDYMSIVV